jgi:hypothetical protein
MGLIMPKPRTAALLSTGRAALIRKTWTATARSSEKLLIVIRRAYRIGMPLDLHAISAGVSEQDAGEFAEFLAGIGIQRRLVEIEQIIRQVDDQAARPSPGL